LALFGDHKRSTPCLVETLCRHEYLIEVDAIAVIHG
jgi:hypothetical protein